MIITLLPDQKRLHLQHGPIDLIIEAFGEEGEIARAYQAASQRFKTVLDELVAELPWLRTAILPSPLWGGEHFSGTIAKTMFAATQPFAANFITPMAAVAGAVADEILGVMTDSAKLDKAYVNNGGDIAFYLNPGQSFQTGVVADPGSGELVTVATITPDTGINGIATSGWHGRSHSLGVADSVTVFAASAAIADAAATIIANQIDLPQCPAIKRQPANHLSPDSDLGSQLVTTAVGSLTTRQIERALTAGENKAQQLCQAGLIIAAFISLKGKVKIAQWPFDALPAHVPQLIVPQSNAQPLQNRIAHA